MNSIHNQSTCHGKSGKRLIFAVALLAIAGMAEAATVPVYAKASPLTELSANPPLSVYGDPDEGGEDS